MRSIFDGPLTGACPNCEWWSDPNNPNPKFDGAIGCCIDRPIMECKPYRKAYNKEQAALMGKSLKEAYVNPKKKEKSDTEIEKKEKSGEVESYAKFYLLQRGKFNLNLKDANILYSSRDDAVINLDYMGSAEFEFGQTGRSLRRILHDFDRYTLFTSKFNKDITICLFCKPEQKDGIIDGIKMYLDKPWRTKERTDLRNAFSPDPISKTSFTIDFWWDLGVGHDWMMFIYTKERYEAFKKAFVNLEKEYLIKNPDEDRRENQYKEDCSNTLNF